MLVGVLDQTSPSAAPDYGRLRAQSEELSAFTQALSARVGAGCPVLQLPVVSFPEEPPPGTMGDYDHLLPAISSPAGTTWSYGAIRGTQRGDWQLALPVGDTSTLLRDAAAAGFCAVEIDRDGYGPSNDPSAAVGNVAGPPIARAARANLAAYDLRPLREELESTLGEAGLARRREDVLRPVVASLNGSLVDTSAAQPSQWTGPTALLTISNMGARAVDVDVSMVVEGVGPDTRTVTIKAPGRPDRDLELTASRGETVTMRLSAVPGRSSVELSATGEVATVPGTEGKQVAVMKVSDLTAVAAGSTVNVASLQQFADASPASSR
jgi:hypothetical protein